MLFALSARSKKALPRPFVFQGFWRYFLTFGTKMMPKAFVLKAFSSAKFGKCKSAFGPVFYISKWLSARPRIDKNRPRRVKNTRKHATQTHATKSNDKKQFFFDLWLLWGSQMTPKIDPSGLPRIDDDAFLASLVPLFSVFCDFFDFWSILAIFRSILDDLGVIFGDLGTDFGPQQAYSPTALQPCNPTIP